MSRKQYLQDLSALNVKDLVNQRKELRRKLFELKMSNVAGSVKKVSDIRLTRRNIARVNTVLSHKIAQTYGSSVN